MYGYFNKLYTPHEYPNSQPTPENIEITYTEAKLNPSDPNVWGPSLWLSLHTGAITYPIAASPITAHRMRGFILGLPFILPCETCSAHAIEYVEKSKPILDHVCSGRQPLFKFFVDFHNSVNARLGKPIVTIDHAYKMYSGQATVKSQTRTT